MSDFVESEKSSAKLAEVLGLLVQASESGNFNVVLNAEHLDGEDTETVRLINKVVSNYSVNVQEFVDYAHDLIEHQSAVEKTQSELFEANKSLDITKSILKDSEVMICVNDSETAKILFMTESYKRHFGIEEDVSGKTCYEVLYPEQNRRCEWCPCHMLDDEPYEPVIWNERNAKTGGYYRNTDRYVMWPDGRRVHIQHRIDLTDSKKIQESLEKQHMTVSVFHEMAMMLLNANEDTLDDSMAKALELVGRCVSADRIQIWRNETLGGVLHFTKTYKWLSDFGKECTSVANELSFPYSAVPRWEERFADGEGINCPLCELPPEEYEFMRHYDIKTLAIIPLFMNGEFWGFLSADDCCEERRFSDEEISNFKSTERLIMTAVAQNEMLASIRAERDRNAALSHWHESILDAVPHAITVTDTNMRYVFVNQSALNLIAKGREEVLGQPCSIAKAPICGTEDCSIVRAKKGVKQTYFKRDGLSFQVNTENLKDLDGETTAYVEVIQDITMIEEMAEKQASAEAASEAKTKFLANMSHEIRTPINSIIGFTELAIDSAISPNTIEYLQMINVNTELLMEIINDILDISKVESGDITLEIIPFDLQALYESCLSVMLPKAKEKNITLCLTAEVPEGKKVFGDPTRLAQVLINLLSNAMKFTDAGSVELSVFTESSDEQSVTMRFGVKDTGIGMTREQLQIVFEPFVQADLSTTRKYGGTGLGLAISKKFVELMGGHIHIESEPDVGTAVSFTLTFDTADRADDSMDKNYAGKLDKPVFEGVVLVCEDNEMNQRVIREHLEHVGFKVEIAENGKDGVLKVCGRVSRNEPPFDMIFMDIHMPVMDGIEAVPKINEMGTGTPIVALTANIMSGDRERYKAIGMKDYISKPFTAQELYRCLLRHMKPVGFGGIKDLEREEDIKLKNQLRKDFVTGNQRKADEIAEAVSAGDIVSAHRIAHTLKSTAELIDRPELRNAAADVEAALKNGENLVTETQMSALRSVLSAALGELAPYLEEDDDFHVSDESGGEYDAEKAREVFQKLKPLLNSGNLESLDYVEAIRAIPGSGELLRHMADLYFDKAAKALAELESTLQTNSDN